MTTLRKPANALAVHVRWMFRKDMPEVLGIEAANFDYPWTEENFLRCLRQRNCIGMVAENEAKQDKVFGYMVYELHKNRLHILNFAVHAAMFRKGVGTAMVQKLVGKLNPQRSRRSHIMLEIRESNLDAQLFFKAMGFRAISLLRDFYEDTTEDAYLFQFRYTGGES